MALNAPARTDALVTLDGVSKRFANGTLALRGMDLTVGADDFISLLGASGCGKSTVLRIIAGLVPVTEGHVQWHSPPAVGQTGRNLGFVFQDATLMPWATIFDNVWLPLRLAGTARDAAERTVRDALSMVGLSQFAEVYPRELSGGMKMRVSIARALVTRPRVLLMDEPFAALDEMTRNKLNHDLLAIRTEHRFAVVFVTHSVIESVFLSNRIVVMAPRPGRVVEQVTIDEPYPRSGDGFGASPRYHAQVRAVQTALHRTLDGTDIDH